jgi:hypothetical protein
MRTRTRRSTVLAAAAAAAGFVLWAVAPAHAAEQTVIENPAIDGPGVCSESGLIGQTFTPQVGGELTQYGFSIVAPVGGAGAATTATVTISEWIDGGALPIVEDDVQLTLSGDQPFTMFVPPQPVLLTAGSTYAVEFDPDGFDTCPVAFGPGEAYDGGELLFDGAPADPPGDLAFQLVLGGLGGVNPGAPTLTGTPPGAVVNAHYSFQFTVTGDPAPTVDVLSGPLPPGLTLTERGLLSGTPTEAGIFPVMFNAENGQDPSAQLFHTFIIGAGLGAPDPTTAPPAAAPAPAAGPPSTPARGSPKSSGLAESGADVLPALWLGGAALLAGAAALAVGAARRRGER